MALQMKYFVLKPKAKSYNDQYARASQSAMMTYARLIKETDPELANEIYNWVAGEELLQDDLKWKEKK